MSTTVGANVMRPDFRAVLKQPTVYRAQTFIKDTKLSLRTSPAWNSGRGYKYVRPCNACVTNTRPLYTRPAEPM